MKTTKSKIRKPDSVKGKPTGKKNISKDEEEDYEFESESNELEHNSTTPDPTQPDTEISYEKKQKINNQVKDK